MFTTVALSFRRSVYTDNYMFDNLNKCIRVRVLCPTFKQQWVSDE
jgi:hypothetical protein